MRLLGTLLKVLALGAVALLLALLAADNPQVVPLSLSPLPLETRLPLFLPIVLAFCSGLLAGGMFISLRHIRLAHDAAMLARRVAALENELAGIKHDRH